MWTNKQVVILGAARQGIALARYLVARGARVTLSDMNANADLSGLADLAGQYNIALGGHPIHLLDSCALLCLSGGVPIDTPIVLEAKRRGIALSNDAQIFFEVCPAPIIGITGSAGKTTTTTLVGNMLEMDKQANVFVGGNIGNPLISDVQAMQPSDNVVMELSSFQLELMTRSPHIACVTNITPNHLDRHGTMENYIAAKKHILDFQREHDWQVLCADDPVTRQLNTLAQTAWFSATQEPAGAGAWLDDGGNLRLRVPTATGSQVICHRRELQLMGTHNVLNVLAAAMVSTLAGAPMQAIRAIAVSFKGVAHRLQLVSNLNGARWYDDSIATAPERMMAGLRAFDNHESIILLVGGRDKHLPWDEAAALMLRRCKHIILFGEMADMVAEELERQKVKGRRQKAEGKSEKAEISHQPPVTSHRLLEDAVREAKRVAGQGDVVLLSPGGTSYDAFKDFAERGDQFSALAQA